MNFIINYTTNSGVPHKHKNYELIVCTGGSGTFYCDKFEREISAGEIIIIPPETTHNIVKKSTAERIYISGEFNQFFNFDSINIIRDNKKGEALSLAKMIYENRHGNYEYLCALINAFIHFILCNIKIDSKIHILVEEIANQITNEFGNSDLSLSKRLNDSGYSEDYIRMQFKKITGKTPTEFLTNVRITHACYLIDTYRHTVPLTEIAQQCGYIDYIYFSKKFKQITGVSPRKYAKVIVDKDYR